MKSTDRLNQINGAKSQPQTELLSDPVPSPMPSLAPTPRPHRLLRLKDVMAATGVAKTFIYAQIKLSRFPAPVKAGCASLWAEAEVQRWIEERIACRQSR